MTPTESRMQRVFTTLESELNTMARWQRAKLEFASLSQEVQAFNEFYHAGLSTQQWPGVSERCEQLRQVLLQVFSDQRYKPVHAHCLNALQLLAFIQPKNTSNESQLLTVSDQKPINHYRVFYTSTGYWLTYTELSEITPKTLTSAELVGMQAYEVSAMARFLALEQAQTRYAVIDLVDHDLIYAVLGLAVMIQMNLAGIHHCLSDESVRLDNGLFNVLIHYSFISEFFCYLLSFLPTVSSRGCECTLSQFLDISELVWMLPATIFMLVAGRYALNSVQNYTESTQNRLLERPAQRVPTAAQILAASQNDSPSFMDRHRIQQNIEHIQQALDRANNPTEYMRPTK